MFDLVGGSKQNGHDIGVGRGWWYILIVLALSGASDEFIPASAATVVLLGAL